MGRERSAEDKLSELTTAYDAVIGLLHSDCLSDETRRKAESLLAQLAGEIIPLYEEKSTTAA